MTNSLLFEINTITREEEEYRGAFVQLIELMEFARSEVICLPEDLETFIKNNPANLIDFDLPKQLIETMSAAQGRAAEMDWARGIADE